MSVRHLGASAVLAFLASCGGGGGGEDGPAQVFNYSGTVTSAAGAPLAGIRVDLTVFGDVCPCQFFCDYTVFGNAVTDANGAFSISANVSFFYGKCVQYRVLLQSQSTPCTADRSTPCFGATENEVWRDRKSLQSMNAMRVTPESMYRVFGSVAFPNGLAPGTTGLSLHVDCYSPTWACAFAGITDVANPSFFIPSLHSGYTYEIGFQASGCAFFTPRSPGTGCNEEYVFTPSIVPVAVANGDIDLTFTAVPK
jgi:hypothetical protein